MDERRVKEVLLYGNYLIKKIELLKEQQITPNQVREQLGLKKI